MPFYSYRFQRGTAAQWASANPILDEGEFGYESNTGRIKVGDGITPWAGLEYKIDRLYSTDDVSKLTAIEYGAQVNPGQVTGDDIQNMTSVTTLRSYSPADIAAMIDAHGGGGFASGDFLVVGDNDYLVIGADSYLTIG